MHQKFNIALWIICFFQISHINIKGNSEPNKIPDTVESLFNTLHGCSQQSKNHFDSDGTIEKPMEVPTIQKLISF